MHNTCVEPGSVACTGDGHFIVGSYNNYIHKYNIYGQLIWENKNGGWWRETASISVVIIIVDHISVTITFHYR